MLLRVIKSLPSFALAAGLTCAASAALCATVLGTTKLDRGAFWIESTVCSVVVKTTIDAVNPLLSGNPVETLAGIPANCTGNMMVQSEIQGGVRLLLQQGFRVTSVSHQITPLLADGGSRSEERRV